VSLKKKRPEKLEVKEKIKEVEEKIKEVEQPIVLSRKIVNDVYKEISKVNERILAADAGK
jgi:hypothetical protein